MTSTCGNRLLQADPEAVCAEIRNTNGKRCYVRETHMLRCMHLGTQAKTKTMQEPLCGWPDPTLSFRHSKEAQGHLSPVPKAAPSLAKTGSRQQALPNL